jgi:hypothetical protein
MSRLRSVPVFLAAMLVWACVEQEPSRPTEDDVKIIKQNILEKAPEMKFKVNADLEGKITYLGLDCDKAIIQPGEPFKLTHYWKVQKALDEGWEIFVHLNGPNKAGFINADHRAIGNRYPAARWKAGEIVRDEHTVSIPANWKDATMSIYTGMWKGRMRLKVKGPQDDENRILAATIPVGAAKPGAVRAAAEKSIIAARAKKPVKIDGKLDDEVWKVAPSSGAFVDTLSGAAVGTKTEVKLAWDDKYLYVAFENQDEDVWSSLKNRDDKLWTEEAVEVFIDADADGKDYIELQVNPNNAIFDSYLPSYRANQNDWNSKMKTAVAVEGTVNQRKDKDKGWTVEMAIPWADTKGRGESKVKLPPKVGDTWRVNFFRMDLPEGKPQQAMGWSPPLVGDFHKIDRFGQLVFGDEAGKAPAPAAKPEEKKAEEKKAEGKPEEAKAEEKENIKANVVRAAIPSGAGGHVLKRELIHRPVQPKTEPKPESK